MNRERGTQSELTFSQDSGTQLMKGGKHKIRYCKDRGEVK